MDKFDNCLARLLNAINMIQKNALNINCQDSTCTKPFLGNNLNNACFNTRPIVLYLCNNNPVTLNYTSGDETLTTTVFRIENVTNNCIKVLLLEESVDGGVTTYTTTNTYATINLDCICAVRCLGDTIVNNIQEGINIDNRDCEKICISKTLNFILELQRRANRGNTGCESALGNDGILYNTRPINLYSCCTGEIWVMPFTLNGETGESNVFKITKVDENCATFEILAPNPDTTNVQIPYISTNNFFTINLDCILAMQCLNDTYTS